MKCEHGIGPNFQTSHKKPTPKKSPKLFLNMKRGICRRLFWKRKNLRTHWSVVFTRTSLYTRESEEVHFLVSFVANQLCNLKILQIFSWCSFCYLVFLTRYGLFPSLSCIGCCTCWDRLVGLNLCRLNTQGANFCIS
jgi:hypothetical protein